jgi:tetratricopeptide (TPR) repeat protein
MLAVVLFGALFLQAGPAAAPLSEAQALLDQGKLSESESAVRRYLETNRDSADAHYLLAYILFREQNPKASIEESTAGARYRAPRAPDLKVIGCDYFLMEDYSNADKWLTSSAKMNPRDAITQYFLGRSKYNERHFDEAVSAFTECVRLDPKNVGAVDNLGLAYEGLGKIEEAIEAYKNAVAAANGADAKPCFDLGTLLMENGKTQDALPYLVQAVRIKPGDPGAHRELGKAYLELDRLPEAQAELETALKLAPENAPMHFLLARVFRKRGMADEARIETERFSALTGAHSSPETPLQEARSLLEQGKLPEAEQIMRRYLEVHKSSADAHFLLGYILFKEENARSSIAEYTEGAKYRKPTAAELEAVASDYVLLRDYPDADKWFTKAVEWNPDDALAWYYLGRTKYNENRFEEAIAAFEQSLKLEPLNVKAEDNLGLSYEGLHRYQEALAAYRTAIAWQADAAVKNSGPFLDLGGLLVDTGRVEESVPYLLEASRLSPEEYRVHRQLGKAYAHLDQLEKAEAELEKAAELAPENAPVHFMLAQVYRRQGLLDKAKTESDRYAALTGTKSTPVN